MVYKKYLKVDGQVVCFVEDCGYVFKAKENKTRHMHKKHPTFVKQLKSDDRRRKENRSGRKGKKKKKNGNKNNLIEESVHEELASGNNDADGGQGLMENTDGSVNSKRLAWEQKAWDQFCTKWESGKPMESYYDGFDDDKSLGDDDETLPDETEYQRFYPTMAMMEDEDKYKDFLEYCNAHLAGICVIKPPTEWVPRNDNYNEVKVKNFLMMQQELLLSSDCADVFCCSEQLMGTKTGREFRRYSKKIHAPPLGKSLKKLEKLFWKSIATRRAPYAKDTDQSFFDQNLKGFNFRQFNSSLSKTIGDEDGSGLTRPSSFLGSFMTFVPMQLNPHQLGGMNYLHYGAPKTWYAVPPSYGKKLEEVVAKEALAAKFPKLVEICPEYFKHRTMLINPTFFKSNEIPFHKVDQVEGEIVVTFPYCYHEAFDNGYNLSESVLWCNQRWLNYALFATLCNEEDCGLFENSPKKMNLAKFVRTLQPDNLDAYVKGELVGHHPEHSGVEDGKCGKFSFDEGTEMDNSGKDQGDVANTGDESLMEIDDQHHEMSNENQQNENHDTESQVDDVAHQQENGAGSNLTNQMENDNQMENEMINQQQEEEGEIDAFSTPTSPPTSWNRIIRGKSFAFTGTGIAGCREYVQHRAGKFTQRITKNTDYLVVGKSPNKSVLQTAQDRKLIQIRLEDLIPGDEEQESDSSQVDADTQNKIKQRVERPELKAKSKILRQSGHKEYEQKNYDEALKLYSDAISADPTCVKAYRSRVTCNTKLERYAEGLVDCESIIRLDNSNVQAYVAKGELHAGLNQYVDSRSAFEKALELQADNKRARTGLKLLDQTENKSDDSVHRSDEDEDEDNDNDCTTDEETDVAE